jgi:hypothetical protein
VTAVAVWYVGPRSQEARALPAPWLSMELHLKLAWTLFFTHPDPVMGESFEAMSL